MINRRELIGGALLLGFRLDAASFSPNAFLRIESSGRVTFWIGRTEMGQGVFTSLSQLIAEELDVDLGAVTAVAAPADPAHDHPIFKMQMTGGSLSVMGAWEPFRRAGASARMMLVAAAASKWRVPADECVASLGRVTHERSKRSLDYGKLTSLAARMPVPAEVPLKPASEWRLIGHSPRRVDGRDIVRGETKYGIDVKVPGMLVALIRRPPSFGARLQNYKPEKALAIPGVQSVIAIEAGVAVLANGFWAAKQGRDALDVEWQNEPMPAVDYGSLAKRPGMIAKQRGDITAAPKQLQVQYEVPYLAHATMEPLNCVAHVTGDACEIWTGTQYQKLDREAAAGACALPLEKVKVHTMHCGGGFGRRWARDSHFVLEAVQLSKAVKAPVKVIWTREDDIRGGWYRPRYLHRVEAGIDADGLPVVWDQTIVGQPILVGTSEEKNHAKNGLDGGHIGGAGGPYFIPNLRVDIHMTHEAPPTSAYRAVGGTHNPFVTDSVLDELAAMTGADPLEYRLKLLAHHPKMQRVLKLAADKAGWPSKGMGIGVADFHGTLMAQIAEVQVSEDREIQVKRIVCAADCGIVVNPVGLEAQIEGGILFGLSAVLHSEITIEDGKTKQSNFHDYKVLRMRETPKVDVYVVPSNEPPRGMGEPPVAPVAGAIANAVFSATGQRLRRLPLRIAAT